MRILMLKGSPNIHGSSAVLAESFADGASEAGHDVRLVDVTHANIHPCLGCIRCGYEGPCAQKDGMKKLKADILKSDMLVFVTPLYYYGFSSQLKIVIDRFCAFNSSLHAKHMRSALIAAAWNSADWTFDALKAHYLTLVRYLNFRDEGMILGAGCGTPSMTKASGYPEAARRFGLSVRD